MGFEFFPEMRVQQLMTAKEIALTAFEGKKPGRVPVSWLGGGPWSIAQAGETFFTLMNEPRRMAEVIVRTHQRIPTDMVFVGSGFNNFHVGALGGRMKFRRVGAPDLEKPLIASLEDIQRLEIENFAAYPVTRAVRKATEFVRNKLGNEVLVAATSWGPFTLSGQLYGVEQLMHGIYRAQEVVKRVVEFATRVIIRFYEPLIEDGLEVVSIADPTASGDLISRDQFEEFALPALREFGDWVRQRRAKFLLHICGDTSDRLDLIAETGAHCFSLDSKVSVSAASPVLRGRIGIAGNIDPIRVLAQGTADDVRREVEKCLRDLERIEGFMLMPGCDLAPGTPEENIRAFIETARSWRFQKEV